MHLNADLGETELNQVVDIDQQLMPLLDQANIACGYHAGDRSTMKHTVACAVASNVCIGAHPSYPDREHFGRRSMTLSDDQLSKLLIDQIATLDSIARTQGTRVEYVKPHGALYNDMMANPKLLETIMTCISHFPTPLKLMLLSTERRDQHLELAERFNIELIFEGFADRAYNDDGSLVSREQPHAVLNANAALKQVKQLLETGCVTSTSGSLLKLPVDSICVHGDNPEALAMVKEIRALLA